MITSSGFQIVDVRDVAAVHRALIDREPPCPGRFIATGRYMPWEEFAELLDRAAGIRLPRVHLPGRLVRAFGRIGDRLRPFYRDLDPTLSREATRLATQWVAFDASRAESELGVKFRDPVETLYDTVRWLAEQGHVDPARALRFTHPGRGRN
jgi:nucleoside-diphosphate-sugar epimerase